MKIKTSELTGAALDWAVATCEGFTDYNHATETMMPPRKEYGRVNFDEYSYSTDWACGGPIIERDNISIEYMAGAGDAGADVWVATRVEGSSISEEQGGTPLVAAMRAYVASQLGKEVEIPEELK